MDGPSTFSQTAPTRAFLARRMLARRNERDRVVRIRARAKVIGARVRCCGHASYHSSREFVHTRASSRSNLVARIGAKDETANRRHANVLIQSRHTMAIATPSVTRDRGRRRPLTFHDGNDFSLRVRSGSAVTRPTFNSTLAWARPSTTTSHRGSTSAESSSKVAPKSSATSPLEPTFLRRSCRVFLISTRSKVKPATSARSPVTRFFELRLRDYGSSITSAERTQSSKSISRDRAQRDLYGFKDCRRQASSRVPIRVSDRIEN